MPLLLAQSAAMMSVVVAVLLALLSAMVGAGLWVAKRELARNDKAHEKLTANVEKLLAAVARIEGLLEGGRG